MSIESRGKVVIALDFGTTTSKGAYYAPRALRALSALHATQPTTFRESEIYAIELSNNGHTEPTKLAWHKRKGHFVYGSDVDRELHLESIPPGDIIHLPKLSLDRSDQTSLRESQKDQREQMPHKDGMPLSSIDLVAQYLCWFKDRLLQSIKANLGCSRYEDLGVADDATWVLTLPANWEEASDDLRQAGVQAGLRNVQLVTETEAAAAAMLRSSEDSDRDLAQEPILVLDVGGGTHNVITYLVKSDGTMQEGVPGTGGLSGSYWLNKHFQDLLKDKWRYKVNDFLVDQGGDPKNITDFWKLLDDFASDFENEKKRFDGFSAHPDDSQMVIPIRGIHDPTRGPDTKSIVLSKSTCETMFAKIIDPIITSVRKQITNFNAKHYPLVIKQIFFFGGLSKSLHVRKTLAKRFFDEEIMGYPVDLVLPPTSISEVVVARGAVRKSLRRDIITTRFRRRNFGVVSDIATNCIPNHIRGNAPTVRDIEDNVERLRNRAIWLFRNGEEFKDCSVRVHRGWRSLPAKAPMRIREYLISSQYELEQYVDILHPPNEVTHAGFLEFDLSQQERQEFVGFDNKIMRQAYRYFEYEVRFTVGYLVRHFEVVIPRNGRFPKDWRKVPGTSGIENDARLAPEPIRRRLPIVRQLGQKDVEDDPRHIFKLQDERLEEMLAWNARGPGGHWDTEPRDLKRQSRLRNAQASDLNSPRSAIPRSNGIKEPVMRRRVRPDAIKKKSRLPSGEQSVRTLCECQLSPSTGPCSICDKAVGESRSATQPEDTTTTRDTETSGTMWKPINKASQEPDLGSAVKMYHPIQRTALQALGQV
ncbi:MAG: hypothetical protein LQ349_005465 [Xanthoria aureola]|nr:MAG: hypothetical protein LQ349_005465 [Xanthoria aureola]